MYDGGSLADPCSFYDPQVMVSALLRDRSGIPLLLQVSCFGAVPLFVIRLDFPLCWVIFGLDVTWRH